MPAEQPIFQDLKISVTCQPNSEGELLTRELQRTRAQVTVSWPQPERLPEGYDVIYCEYFPGLVHTLPWAPGEATSALVVVLFPDVPYDLKAVCNCSPDAVLHSPFAPREVTTSLVIARDRFQYIKRLQKRIDRLDETLRSTRQIERAKQILMSSRDMNEQEAYDYLRRNAMKRRVSIAVLATAVVDSDMLLG